MFWPAVIRDGCLGAALFFLFIMKGRPATSVVFFRSNINQTFSSPPNASDFCYARKTELLPIRRISDPSEIGNAIKSFPFTTRQSKVTEITENAHTYLALTEFLVSNARGRHFYLVFDSTFEGIIDFLLKNLQAEIQRNIQGQRNVQDQRDITVFRYDVRLLSLEEALKGFHYIAGLRNVLVFCSSKNTLDLFRKITAKKLQLRSVYWYVILEEDIATDITDIVKEGTQMTLVIKANERYKLFTSYVNTDMVDFTDCGSLLVHPLYGYPKKIIPFLKRPLYRPLKEVYKDFGGRLMRSAVVPHFFFFDVEILSDGSMIPVAGMDYMVLDTLAEKLNFTYQIVIPEDGEWGKPRPDGSFSGMIGEVVSNRANFAIEVITITSIREQVVDFTHPYYFDNTIILSRAPAVKDKALAIFSPFTPLVWLLLAVSTITMGVVLKLIMSRNLMRSENGENNKTIKLSSYVFTTFRVLVLQGNPVEVRFWGHRLLLYSWFLFCFILYVMYGGFLTALLTIPSYEDTVDSLYDIPKAVEQDGFQVVFNKGSTSQRFSKATSGIYARVWELFDPNTGYVSITKIVDKVLTGKYLYMSLAQGLTVAAKSRDIKKFHISRDSFYPQAFGMACSNGAPYKANLDSILLQLRAAGFIIKWTRDEVNKVPDPKDSDTGNNVVFTLIHMQGAFFLLVLGYMLAVTASLVEYLFQKTNVSYLDTE